jgi:hypothetical protein
VHVTVDLSSEPADVSLGEPEDCSRFDLVVHGTGGGDDLDRALVSASMGRMEGDDALVAVDRIRELAAGSVGVGWETDFAAMLDYARSRGWLSGDDAAIRAHIVWS